jgi:hypothetical protein
MTASMQDAALALPALLLVGQTFVVWLLMYRERIGEMRRRHIAAQAVASRAAMRAQLQETRATDNFHNLLELPILFYFLTTLYLLLDLDSGYALVLAWSFVGLRVVHSAIQITYNRVKHRFLAYVLGGVALLAMWLDALHQVFHGWSGHGL